MGFPLAQWVCSKRSLRKLLLVNAGWQGSVGATSSRRGFAANADFLRMQSKSFRLHRTERANDHIKQGNAVFFARNPIGATYNQLPQCSQERFITLHYLFITPEYLQ